MMIWKNLPKPTNKEIVAKASKFEAGLFRIANKIMRFSLGKFKDEQYVGNDRKKMAIRKLVEKSCSGIDKYFTIWKKNNDMITLFSKLHKVTSMATIIHSIEMDHFRLLFEGNKSQKVEASFMKIGKWWENKKFKAFLTWKKKSK